MISWTTYIFDLELFQSFVSSVESEFLKYLALQAMLYVFVLWENFRIGGSNLRIKAGYSVRRTL